MQRHPKAIRRLVPLVALAAVVPNIVSRSAPLPDAAKGLIVGVMIGLAILGLLRPCRMRADI
ncbi:hypothetical protein [Neoasaia chiangmaiensis]|uniref:Uncharacterized protein n=1 Tax=Neoasaia chiangmaiensis TaxID=320497 RepID=A0A1U9KRB2_9PROT|nr:hypothetical protein [Neoasaia chiangmaiensis]AQS88401.1 hypothetical protein A0U93_11120 [Neoasaia chiangmaiensis]